MKLYDLSKQAASMSGQISEGDIQAIQRSIYDIFGMMANVDESELKEIEKTGNKAQALARAKQIQQSYAQSNDNMIKSLAQFMSERINRMEGKAPVADTAARQPAKAQ
jgi:hypothetical protein